MTSKSAVVTARLDPTLAAMLDELARTLDRSRAWIVAKAVERYVREETEFRGFVQEGADATERGDYITHEQLVAEIEQRRGTQRAA